MKGALKRNKNDGGDRPFNPSISQVGDSRLTTCSNCKYGIFKGTEYKWTSIGLVHEHCKTSKE